MKKAFEHSMSAPQRTWHTLDPNTSLHSIPRAQRWQCQYGLGPSRCRSPAAEVSQAEHIQVLIKTCVTILTSTKNSYSFSSKKSKTQHDSANTRCLNWDLEPAYPVGGGLHCPLFSSGQQTQRRPETWTSHMEEWEIDAWIVQKSEATPNHKCFILKIDEHWLINWSEFVNVGCSAILDTGNV
jgi:hypothetical protein